jgi:membrane protein required for colicin V production
MNGLDWVLIGLGVFCILRGFFRGAVSQVIGIAGVLGGFIVAAHFYQSVGAQLRQAFPQFNASAMVSFIVLFFLTWFCVGVVGFWISKTLRKTGMAFLDRLMGGAIGFAKALILVLILVSAMTLFASPKSRLLAGSTLTPYVYSMARAVVQATPQNVQKIFEEKRKELERFWMERKEQPRKPDRHRREEKSV